jgi:hypothetical protein
MESLVSMFEHLSKPLVLASVALLLLAGLIKLFNLSKLSSNATERLMSWGIIFCFVLSLLIMVFAFIESYQQVESNATPVAAGGVSQATSGDCSPTVNTAGSVVINCGIYTGNRQVPPRDPTPPPDKYIGGRIVVLGESKLSLESLGNGLPKVNIQLLERWATEKAQINGKGNFQFRRVDEGFPEGYVGEKVHYKAVYEDGQRTLYDTGVIQLWNKDKTIEFE